MTENITDNMTVNIKKFEMLQIMSLTYHYIRPDFEK